MFRIHWRLHFHSDTSRGCAIGELIVDDAQTRNSVSGKMRSDLSFQTVT